jgi:hypothetical protein
MNHECYTLDCDVGACNIHTLNFGMSYKWNSIRRPKKCSRIELTISRTSLCKVAGILQEAVNKTQFVS